MGAGVSTAKVAVRRRLGRSVSITALTAVGLLPAGCFSGETAAVEESVRDFQQAVVSDPAQACTLLASGTVQELESTAGADCALALQDADLPIGGEPIDTVVAGHSARVVLENDTIFLALFDDGWRVIAAGCAPPSNDSAPYDCTVEGP